MHIQSYTHTCVCVCLFVFAFVYRYCCHCYGVAQSLHSKNLPQVVQMEYDHSNAAKTALETLQGMSPRPWQWCSAAWYKFWIAEFWSSEERKGVKPGVLNTFTSQRFPLDLTWASRPDNITILCSNVVVVVVYTVSLLSCSCVCSICLSSERSHACFGQRVTKSFFSLLFKSTFHPKDIQRPNNPKHKRHQKSSLLPLPGFAKLI